MVRVQNSKKSGSAKAGGSVKKPRMKRRGGVRKPAGVVVGDARLKIIAKNRSKVVDARDKLAMLAKKTDARQKLQKIRNLKEGKLDVKTTAKGGITITTTTKGKLLLTTAKKAAGANKKSAGPENKKPFGRKMTDGGVMKNRGRNDRRSDLMTASKRNDLERGFRSDGGHSRRNDDRRPPALGRDRDQGRSDAGNRHRAPSHHHRPPRHDYDDPRQELVRDEDVYSRRLQHQAPPAEHFRGRTMADRISETGGNFVSPLQGTKVVVSNLLSSVTQEDICELFGDVGPLKRAKVTKPGTAEVVYVNYADAQKAIAIYNNRLLDGKSMECQIVGQPSNSSEGTISSFIRTASGGDAPAPDLSAVHKALFNDRRRPALPSTTRPSLSYTEATRKTSRHYY